MGVPALLILCFDQLRLDATSQLEAAHSESVSRGVLLHQLLAFHGESIVFVLARSLSCWFDQICSTLKEQYRLLFPGSCIANKLH